MLSLLALQSLELDGVEDIESEIEIENVFLAVGGINYVVYDHHII